MYGFGAYNSKPEARASTLARYDGFEVLGKVTGTFFSPLVLTYLTAHANYTLKIACVFVVLLYVMFMVKDPPKETKLARKFKLKSLTQPLGM